MEGNPVAGFGGGGGTIDLDLGMARRRAGSIEDLEVLGDGRIVAAGSAYVGIAAEKELIVARFTAAGQLDPSFAAGGIFRGDPTPGIDEARALEVQPDGKLVVAGVRGESAPDSGDGDTWLLRLTTAASSIRASEPAGKRAPPPTPRRTERTALPCRGTGGR